MNWSSSQAGKEHNRTVTRHLWSEEMDGHDHLRLQQTLHLMMSIIFGSKGKARHAFITLNTL